jgi:hypothetical protein
MRSWIATTLCLVGLLATGCAHHQANQYSYAPPLAPPVYPQPQPVGGPTAPVVYPAAPGATPMPGAAPAAGAAVAAPHAATVAGDPCCPPLVEGGIVGTPVVYEAAGQTPPCPPAH